MLTKTCGEYYSLIYFCLTYSFAFLFFKFIRKKHFITILFASLALPHFLLTMKNFMNLNIALFKGLNPVFVFALPALMLLSLDRDDRTELQTLKEYLVYLIPSLACMISFFFSDRYYFQMLLIMGYVVNFYLIFSAYVFSTRRFRKLIVCSAFFLLTLNFFSMFFRADPYVVPETLNLCVMMFGVMLPYFDFNRYEIATITRWGMIIFVFTILIMMIFLHFFFNFDPRNSLSYLDFILITVFFVMMFGLKKLFKNEVDRIIHPDRSDILLKLRELIIRCMEFESSGKMLQVFCEFVRRLLHVEWVAVFFGSKGEFIFGRSKGVPHQQMAGLEALNNSRNMDPEQVFDQGMIFERLDRDEYSVSMMLGRSRFRILDLRHTSYIQFLLINLYSVLRRNDLVIKLKDTNNELLKTMGKLRETQKKLISSERLAALGTMSGVIAHEIRNPLGTLKLSMNHLYHAVAEADLKELVDMASSEIERLNRMVDSLVEYSRKSEPAAVFFRPQSEIEKILSLHRDSCAAQINVKLDNEMEILFDRDFFYQIFYNLFQNAVAAIQDTIKKEITISLGYYDPAIYRGLTHVSISECPLEARPCLCVEDTGCGIAEESLKKIFEPFFTTKTRGSGIGLAQVVKLIEISGADLMIQSDASRGTSVLCVFPPIEQG